MDIVKLLGYEGKNVVITGAASGMAYCAAQLLVSLGAKVYAVVNNKPCDLPVEASVKGNLSVKEEIDRVSEELPERIDVLFMCHGVGIKPGKEKFVMMTNFVGQRYMAEKLLPRIPDGGSVTFISSSGGYGWKTNMKAVGSILSTADFESAEKWVEEHLEMFAAEDAPDPYAFSKQCVSAYVKSKTRAPEYIGRKIRINAIGPSFTETAIIKDFNLAVSKDGSEASGASVMYDLFLKSWNGRAGRPEEMGYPLVIFGSDLCSYLSGQIIYIDYGMTGQMDWEAVQG